MSHFGPRIIGEAAFQQQQAKAKGGSVFGPRVRDIPEATPSTSIVQKPGAKNAPGASLDAPTDEGLSVEQFEKILRENASFLDTLYIQELSRAGGPRRECLLVARSVAIQITTYGDMVQEIDGLLADMAKATETPAVVDPAATTAPDAPEPPKVPDVPPAADPAAEAAARRAAVDARVAEVEKLDKMAPLVAIAEELGLPKPVSKAAAKESIIAKLREGQE